MAFLILHDGKQSQFADAYVYFDEDCIQDYKRVLELYFTRIHEIRFERPVKMNQLIRITAMYEDICKLEEEP